MSATSSSVQNQEVIWESLRAALVDIQKGNSHLYRFEEVYRQAYTLVLHKQGQLVYKGVSNCIIENVAQMAAAISAVNDAELFSTIVQNWQQHKANMQVLTSVLMFLDTNYCQKNRIPGVYALGMSSFRTAVLDSGDVAVRLGVALANNIAQERKGSTINRTEMKAALTMLVEADVGDNGSGGNSKGPSLYDRVFQTQFIADTAVFYAAESKQALETGTVVEYLALAHKRLTEEDARIRDYLNPASEEAVLGTVQELLITSHLPRIVEDETTGIDSLFVAENKTALTLAYKLMAREHTALPHFRNAMVKCIKNAGTQIVSAPESAAKPSALVHKVQEVKTKYANLIDTCFNQDRTFHKALKKALVYFVNHDSRFAKYLSLHLDELLRKETKVADDADITAAIMSTMSIFRLLQDKDIFEDYYKQHLAHRLLTSTSVSSEAEELVLSKLQAECGHQFTSRLSGMFKDMEMSTQMGQGFKWHLEKENSLIMDVKVTVLTTGYWPLPRVTPCVLPSAATLITEQFLAFYTNLHTGRKLHWQSNLGTAELRCQFGSTRKELLVSTYQMCILNLFNEKQTYTLAEIKEATKIPDTDLIRHILSLAHPRVRVLVKSPNTKTVEDSHTFSWNHEYKSNRHRVKIPLLQSAKSSVDKNANPNAVPTGVLHKRQIQVDATIVRIMKAAKTLAHNKLVADVISSMSQVFAVEPAFIKRRIEHLMKGEFLQRDVENRRTYHYVA